MLTDKELQVLLLRKEGLRQTEIAARLDITQGAVSRFEASAKAKILEMHEELALVKKLGIDNSEDTQTLDTRAKKLQDTVRRSKA